MDTAGFAVVFAVIWLAVAGTTIAHYLRPGDQRPDISVIARAGLLIWASGVLAFFAASWRHWPPSRMSQMQFFLETCKTAGFALMLVGWARYRWLHRAGRRVARQSAQPPASP